MGNGSERSGQPNKYQIDASLEEPTLSSMSASFEMEPNASAQPERSLALRASFLVLVCAGSVGIYCPGPPGEIKRPSRFP